MLVFLVFSTPFIKGAPMQTAPTFKITKSGITITPNAFSKALAYTKYFLRVVRTKLSEYNNDDPSHHQVVSDMQREISRAEAFREELEQAQGQVIHIYDVNFKREADIFRAARIQLGHARFEENYTLSTVVEIAIQRLKKDNPTCSPAVFKSYINEGGPHEETTNEI